MHDAPMTTAPLAATPAPSAPTVAASRSMAALAGFAAAALALGISELIAALLPGASSLVAAVGQVVIDLQPPGAKDLVVALFGTIDKLALEVVVVVVALLIGAGLGLLARRSFVLAATGFVAFGLIAFIATLSDPLAMPTMVAVQVAIAVGVGIQTLSSLLRLAGATSRGTAGYSDPARRTFLLRTG